MSKRLALLLTTAVMLGGAAPTPAPAPAKITLPELLAVELPKGARDLGADDAPLHDLLAGASSGKLKVTADLATRVSAGPVKITWTAWTEAGKPAATRSAVVFVLPFGITPVGTSGDENATAGNNAVHIQRDAGGLVHMIWADSGGPSGRTGPVYRRASVAADGTVHLETPPIYVAEPGPGEWNSYPSLAATGNAVQLAWQGGGTVRTRREADGALGPVIDTKAKSGGRDVGPALAADARGGLHLVTPDAVYAESPDGTSWKTEALPVPAGQHVKTVSLASDGAGNVDVAFSSVAHDIANDGKNKGSGGWWQLRTIRHMADGSWTNPQNALADTPGWTSPPPGEDALVDWVRIASDNQGGLHAAWHGTAESRIYGNDSAFYAWRNPAGVWQKPVHLIAQDAAKGVKFSFSPSLAVDGQAVMPVVFYDIYAGANWVGFDSAGPILSHGTVAAPTTPLSHLVADAVAAGHPELALSTRFPAAAPSLWHAPDGHLWLDVLETLIPSYPGSEGKLIVYRRIDVTAAFKQAAAR